MMGVEGVGEMKGCVGSCMEMEGVVLMCCGVDGTSAFMEMKWLSVT